jgi:osmotically-inducible protein OsmY
MRHRPDDEGNRRDSPRSGPKGFRRADNRLLDDIAERLMYADDIDSSDVTVGVKDAKVTLDGTDAPTPARRALRKWAASEDTETRIAELTAGRPA